MWQFDFWNSAWRVAHLNLCLIAALAALGVYQRIYSYTFKLTPKYVEMLLVNTSGYFGKFSLSYDCSIPDDLNIRNSNFQVHRSVSNKNSRMRSNALYYFRVETQSQKVKGILAESDTLRVAAMWTFMLVAEWFRRLRLGVVSRVQLIWVTVLQYYQLSSHSL